MMNHAITVCATLQCPSQSHWTGGTTELLTIHIQVASVPEGLSTNRESRWQIRTGFAVDRTNATILSEADAPSDFFRNPILQAFPILRQFDRPRNSDEILPEEFLKGMAVLFSEWVSC